MPETPDQDKLAAPDEAVTERPVGEAGGPTGVTLEDAPEVAEPAGLEAVTVNV